MWSEVTGIFVGLCIAFWVWLFPPLIVPAIIAGIIRYGFLLYSIGNHMYNAVLHDDVREFQEAMIETSSFMLTTAFFLGLAEWLDIDSYEETGGEGSEGKTPVEEANGEAEAVKSNSGIDSTSIDVPYKWNDGTSTYRVRVHGPDPSAPEGSNSSNGWVVRIQKGHKYYYPVSREYCPSGVTNTNSPNYNEITANDTHIPIVAPEG